MMGNIKSLWTVSACPIAETTIKSSRNSESAYQTQSSRLAFVEKLDGKQESVDLVPYTED